MQGFILQDYCHPKQAEALATIGKQITANNIYTNKKIWLSRAGLKKAAIAGEKEFQIALAKQGFIIIQPELLALDKQIAIFNEAQIITGFIGSAFHTVLLAHKSTAKLIHFSRENNINRNYLTCAKAKQFQAEYYTFFIKKGVLNGFDANVNTIQDLTKIWQVLYEQGLVTEKTYFDPNLELKLQKLDEISKQHYPHLFKKINMQTNKFFDATEIDKLGLKYNTDKSSRIHDYLRFYEFYLTKFKENNFTLLELGVGPENNKGKSLFTWRDYFSNANIIGVDIRTDAKSIETDRVTVEIGNCASLNFLSELAIKYPSNKIVIDDASHVWSHQILAFEKLFPTVESGGIYIMEDIHTSFLPLSEKGYGNCHNADSYTYFSMLTYLVCGNGRKHKSFDINQPTAMQIELAKEIENISFYKETVVLVKK